jgi:hypothetical protein
VAQRNRPARLAVYRHSQHFHQSDRSAAANRLEIRDLDVALQALPEE